MKRRSISVLTVIFSCCLLIFACRKEITNVIHHRKNGPSDIFEMLNSIVKL